MSTKPKPHKTKKAKKKGKKGLAGAEKMAAVKAGMSGEVTRPIGAVLGLISASALGYGLDMIPGMQVDETNAAFQPLTLVKPALMLGAGVGLIYATHGDKSAGASFVNGLGWGMGFGGAVSGFKVFVKKDIFAGLGAADDEVSKQIAEHKKAADYYQNKANDLSKMIEKNKFKIELPALEERPNSENAFKGTGATEHTSAMNLNAADYV
jgi:hypothetical protein